MSKPKPKLRKPPDRVVDTPEAEAFIKGAAAKGIDSKITKKQAAKTVSQPETKRLNQAPLEKKSYVGFYMGQETCDRLELARVRLLQITRARKSDVSKSAIVETAVKIALDDLEANLAQSQLVDKITG